MYIAAKQLYRCSIEGSDGVVGKVKDLLFDDELWRVRYFDVDTGRWLPGRRVILSPQVVEAVDYAAETLATALTQDQVRNSPPLESRMPVSRQREAEQAQYYAWGVYWSETESVLDEVERDSHLQSTRAVAAYRLQAADGEIGQVADFIVDDRDWQIRYLVVDTGKWLSGRQVLIPPNWAEAIHWDTQTVTVGLERATVENSPEYDSAAPINRKYEEVFYDYYGRPRYWTGAGRSL